MYITAVVCVYNCMHVHSPHVGSVLYMHGSTGTSCRMFAPTTLKVFRRLCIVTIYDGMKTTVDDQHVTLQPFNISEMHFEGKPSNLIAIIIPAIW